MKAFQVWPTVTKVPSTEVGGTWYVGRGSTILSFRFVRGYTSSGRMDRNMGRDPVFSGTIAWDDPHSYVNHSSNSEL